VDIATTEWRGSLWQKKDLLVPVGDLQTRLKHIRRGYERAEVPTLEQTQQRIEKQ